MICEADIDNLNAAALRLVSAARAYGRQAVHSVGFEEVQTEYFTAQRDYESLLAQVKEKL